jgi:hypothetical protein
LAHAWSSTVWNVRRSLRRRRQPTRIWCTGVSPSGIGTRNRRYGSASKIFEMCLRRAVVTTSPAVGPRLPGLSGAGGVRSGAPLARSPIARACLGTNAPRAAPAASSAASTLSSSLSPALPRSTSISRNCPTTARPSSTLTVSSATSASRSPSLSRSSYARRTVRIVTAGWSGAPRWNAVSNATRSAGIVRAVPGRVISSRASAAPFVGSFTVHGSLPRSPLRYRIEMPARARRAVSVS